jgi:hypothetical protein
VNLPLSFKRSPVRVILDDRAERLELAHARQRVAELEVTPEDQARMEAEAYADALRQERERTEAKLRSAIAIGPEGTDRLGVEMNGAIYAIDRTGAQLQQEAEAALQAIDAELERVSTTKENA